MKDRSAVISIGTNSTRYMIADFSARRFRFFGQPITRVIEQKSIGTRIGEGMMDGGPLGAEPMRRTLDVIAGYHELIRGHAEHVDAIATSAVRRASNAAEFAERVRALTGVELQILSGEEEARSSFRGAVMSVPHGIEDRIGVFDTGGGSSEYGVGDHDHASEVISCEIGAVRLTEAFPQLAGTDGEVSSKTIQRAHDRAREVLDPICGFERVSEVVFVGGSATSTASLIRGHRGRFAHVAFSQAGLRAEFERVVLLSLRKRKKLPGMNVQRADILPAGMIILDTIFEILNQNHATVSATDLLYGFLLLEHEKLEDDVQNTNLSPVSSPQANSKALEG